MQKVNSITDVVIQSASPQSASPQSAPINSKQILSILNKIINDIDKIKNQYILLFDKIKDLSKNFGYIINQIQSYINTMNYNINKLKDINKVPNKLDDSHLDLFFNIINYIERLNLLSIHMHKYFTMILDNVHKTETYLSETYVNDTMTMYKDLLKIYSKTRHTHNLDKIKLIDIAIHFLINTINSNHYNDETLYNKAIYISHIYHKYKFTTELYVKLINTISKYAKNINILSILETDKLRILQKEYIKIRENNLRLLNPYYKRYGLIPLTKLMNIDELIDNAFKKDMAIPFKDRFKNFQNQGDRHQGDRHQGDRHQGDRHQGDRHQGDRHQGDRQRRQGGNDKFITFKNKCIENNMGLIIMNRHIAHPLTYDTTRLLNRNDSYEYSAIHKPTYGVDAHILKHFNSIVKLNITTKWKFDIELHNITKNNYKKEYVKKIFILESLCPDMYRICGLTTKPNEYTVNLSNIKEFYEFCSRNDNEVVPTRIYNLHKLSMNEAVKNMFSPFKVDKNKLAEMSTIVDPKYLRHIIIVRINEQFKTLLNKKYKKGFSDNYTYAKVIHDESFLILFSDILTIEFFTYLYTRYTEIGEKVHISEVYISYLNVVYLYYRTFIKEMHNYFKDNLFIFTGNTMDDTNQLYRHFDDMIRNVLGKIITDSSNIYQMVLYKLNLLKNTII